MNGWFRSFDFAEQVILASFIIGVIRIKGHASFVREEDVPLRPIHVQIQETREEFGHAPERATTNRSFVQAFAIVATYCAICFFKASPSAIVTVTAPGSVVPGRLRFATLGIVSFLVDGV